jgi:hypothetical protein
MLHVIDIISLESFALGGAILYHRAAIRDLKQQIAVSKLAVRLMATAAVRKTLVKRVCPESELQAPVRRFEDTFSVLDALNRGHLTGDIVQSLREARDRVRGEPGEPGY